MGVDFIFWIRPRVVLPPPGASPFFKWKFVRVPELVIGEWKIPEFAELEPWSALKT